MEIYDQRQPKDLCEIQLEY